MSSSSENLDLPTLHKQLKDAVDGDRRALCAGLGRVHHRRGAFSPYEGGYLTREHLADLVQRKILESASWNSVETWTAEDIFAWLNPLKRDKRLPDRIQDRQLFLESLYRVMADCFQSAGERMSGRRPAEYLNYLGAEPLYIDLPELDFNPADVGFYEITRWNANRVLDEHDNVGEVRRLRRTAQNWVPDEMIERYQEMVLGESGGKGSQCSSLVGFDLDTREDQGSQLIITVTGGWYYQNVVIRDIMRDHRDIYDTLASRITNADGGSLHGGLAAVIAGAPNSNIALNITVSSRSGKVLLIKRTAGVRTWQEYFQVGPHETMNFRPTETKQENCFVLARRALSEELQIEKEDLVGDIIFSWFGYYLPEAQGYFFAHAQTDLSENEIARRIRGAHSSFESGRIEWLELTEENVSSVLEAWSRGPWETVPDMAGRRFLPHAAISLTQLYRVRQQHMFGAP